MQLQPERTRMLGGWAIIYQIKLVIWKLELVLATTRLHPDRGHHNMGTLTGKYLAGISM